MGSWCRGLTCLPVTEEIAGSNPVEPAKIIQCHPSGIYFFMTAEAIQIRDAHPQEVGAIALLIARANAKRDGEPLPTVVEDSQLSDLEERMARPNVWAYVAINEDTVAGFALGYPRTDENTSPSTADTEYISLLMIEPNFWGHRIASRLLDLVAKRARQAGRSRLTLRTRDAANQHARTVYEHKGFMLTGVEKESPYGWQVEYQLNL